MYLLSQYQWISVEYICIKTCPQTIPFSLRKSRFVQWMACLHHTVSQWFNWPVDYFTPDSQWINWNRNAKLYHHEICILYRHPELLNPIVWQYSDLQGKTNLWTNIMIFLVTHWGRVKLGVFSLALIWICLTGISVSIVHMVGSRYSVISLIDIPM